VLPGVSVNVTTASTTPVTLTVARDDSAISDVAGSLVSSLNDILSFITQKQAVTTSTNATGGTVVTAGAFAGDLTARDADQKLTASAQAPIDGISPSTYGIVVARDGSISFDKDIFAASMAADPEKTKAAVQALAARVADAATVVSDKHDGTVTTKITGEQKTVKGLSDQIDDWDTRLADRRSTLEKTYSNLEVQLQQLQSQSSWLTGQLAGLSTSSA
jgi:flagellar hook-associated protein 2